MFQVQVGEHLKPQIETNDKNCFKKHFYIYYSSREPTLKCFYTVHWKQKIHKYIYKRSLDYNVEVNCAGVYKVKRVSLISVLWISKKVAFLVMCWTSYLLIFRVLKAAEYEPAIRQHHSPTQGLTRAFTFHFLHSHFSLVFTS